MPCEKRMKYIHVDQLKGMMRVDLIVARPWMDVRIIMDNFDLDICIDATSLMLMLLHSS